MNLFYPHVRKKKSSAALLLESYQATQLIANQSIQHTWTRPSRSIGTALGITSLLLLLSAAACRAAKSEVTFTAATSTFAPCPDSPNCVSSQADPNDETHYMAALPYTGSVMDAKEKLVAIIKGQPRATIVTEQDTYLHVEYRSLIFRFVDDVEFYIDEAAHLIQFRSASRLGHSDMGVNRKRMEGIREQFVQ